MRHELHLLAEHKAEHPELVAVAGHFIILAELEAGPRTVYELSIATGESLQTTHREVALLEREGRAKRVATADGRHVVKRLS